MGDRYNASSYEKEAMMRIFRNENISYGSALNKAQSKRSKSLPPASSPVKQKEKDIGVHGR